MRACTQQKAEILMPQGFSEQEKTLTFVSRLAFFYGGGEGGRTPVRRPAELSFSERSLRFDIPSVRPPQTGS